MPPAAKRGISLFCLNFDKTEPHFYEGQSLFNDILHREWFFNPSNTTQLILYNCEKTDNRLHLSNVVETFDRFMICSFKTFSDKIKENTSVENKCSWLDVLQLGTEILTEEIKNQKGIVSAQLVLIANRLPDVDSNQQLLEKIIKSQKNKTMKIIIVVPEVPVTFIKDNKELDEWAKTSYNIENIGEGSKLVLKTLCQQGNVAVCNYYMATHLFYSFSCKSDMQPWKSSLFIGSNIEIPINIVRFLKDEMQISVQPLNGEKESPKKTVWVNANDESQEYQFHEITFGVLRWGQFIAFEDNLKSYFSLKDPKGFHLLGFTDRTNVCEHYCCGEGSSVLVPDNSRSQAEKLVDALYKTLLKLNKIGIASKKYNVNCLPKLVALIPCEHDQVILVNEIATGDEIFLNKVSEDTKNHILTDLQTGEQVFDDMVGFVNCLRAPTEHFRLGPQLFSDERSTVFADRLAKYSLGLEMDKNVKIPINPDLERLGALFPDIEEENEDRGENDKQEQEEEDDEYDQSYF